RGGTAQVAHPDDRTAGFDHRHPAALPARHLRLDQERLESTLGPTEGDEALTAPPGADDERRRQVVGVEGHAAWLAGDGVCVGTDESRLERLADLGQLGAPGYADGPLDQRGQRSQREPRERAADFDGHAAELERTARSRDREDALEASMCPRAERSSTAQTRRGLTQDLRGNRTRQAAQALEPQDHRAVVPDRESVKLC